MVAVATTAAAADVGVVGTKLIIVDKTVASSSAKAVFVAKDASITKGVSTDTAEIFAELSVRYDSTSGYFVMPSGEAAWIVNKETVAKYLNSTAPVGGAVRVSVIKPGALIKVVSKSLGDDAIDLSTAPTGDVFVSHTVLNDATATRHCTRFQGCVHKTIARGTGYKLVCLGGIPDAGCGGAPSQACCGSIPGLAAVCVVTPSALACSEAGGTPGASDDVCDSVTGTCTASATAGPCCENLPSPFGPLCAAGPPFSLATCPGVFSASAVCTPDGTCN
jgi:hypothetical protein